MPTVEKKSLQKCISGTKAARTRFSRLMTLPLTEYFKGCEEEYHTLASYVDQAYDDQSFLLFPELYKASSSIDKLNLPLETEKLLYAPILKSDYGFPYFSFSLGTFLDIADAYLPEYDADLRSTLRTIWKSLIDRSLNQILLRLLNVPESADKYSKLHFFSTLFLKYCWEYHTLLPEKT